MPATDGHTYRAIIIGSGFGGLGLAIRMRQSGIEDFVILEKAGSVAGVWRDNEYPGAACDVPSHLYSFSFEPNPEWSHRFARQAEIREYLEHCTDKYGIRPHIQFNAEVASADFDAAGGTWGVRTTDGREWRCRALVTAVGQLSRPLIPRLPGIERFRGASFHSARWRHDVDLAGRRVAVIGTGASAIQFVPEIAKAAGHLTVFQRSAAWLLSRPDRPYPAWRRRLFRQLPFLMTLSRGWVYSSFEARGLAFHWAPAMMKLFEWGFRRRLRRVIDDPALREKLTPDYPMGCKRLLLTDDWLPTFTRRNVELVTDSIREITERGVLTADGREHEADVIVFGTGFAATEFLAPMRIRGLDGRSLADAWRHGAEGYLGTTVSGFPSLFTLYGPNTNLGHNSIVYMLESQFRYVLDCLAVLESRRLRYINVKPGVQRAFNEELQQRLKRTVWERGCTSWYQTAEGKQTNNWSTFTFTYRRRTRHPRLEDYDLVA
jgi:cation diffusion facilitator CzcD-associated flavoprotein CzcO